MASRCTGDGGGGSGWPRTSGRAASTSSGRPVDLHAARAAEGDEGGDAAAPGASPRPRAPRPPGRRRRPGGVAGGSGGGGGGGGVGD